MNQVFRSLAFVLVAAAAAFASPPAGNRVVVLDNENILEGEVTKIEEGYEIRHKTGSVVIPTRRVLAIVADRKAAFGVVAGRANRGDADERLRLARWCAANELPNEAIAEARAAVKMRPGFTAAERYAALMEDLASRKTTPATPAVITAKAELPKPDSVTDVGTVEYNSESFPIFATRINAILLNTCANCHASDDAKSFRLTRMGGRSGATKNMLAALLYVNAKEPASSVILAKAITAHGSATEAPFKTRNHPAFQALESWAQIARAADGTAAPATPPVQEPGRLPNLELKTVPPKSAGPGDAFGQDSKSVPPKPVKQQASDEFDPAIFNGELKKK